MPQIPSPRNGRRPRLEIIPFIDIMFFLLATFMMVSLSMIQNSGIAVNLPGAKTGQQMDHPSERVTITVDRTGELLLNREKVTLVQLEEVLRETYQKDSQSKIILQGDRECPYGKVVEVLDLNRRIGLTKVVILTKVPEGQ
jgi:biopolymer transport protein ExbD